MLPVLSLVFPAYNESQRLPPYLATIQAHLVGEFGDRLWQDGWKMLRGLWTLRRTLREAGEFQAPGARAPSTASLDKVTDQPMETIV